MSGDNQHVSQPLKFYIEEMTETKRIAIAHLEKKLFPVANSVIYLDQKPMNKELLKLHSIKR